MEELMKNKAVCIMALAVLLPGLLFAGGGQPKSGGGGTVTLQLWHRWSGLNEETLNQVIRGFEAKNPGIKIVSVSQPGQYMELLQKMIADIAAGNPAPDLFIGGYNLMNYIHTEMNPVLINNLAPNAAAYTEFTNKYIPSIIKLGEIGGDQIGVPFALSNIVMFYNDDIFRAAGLSGADVPRTWDDVIRAGNIIRQKTGKYAVGMQKVDSWPDLGIIYSNGGKLLSDDGKKVAFNNPQAVEAITMWQSWHRLGLAAVDTDPELMASFIAGNVAMYISSCVKLSSLRKSADFTLKVAECPGFGTKRKTLPAGGAAIMSFTKDKSKYNAIWRFIDYAAGPEAMETFTRSGYLSVIKAKIPMVSGQEAAYAQLEYAVPWTPWPGGSAGLEIDRLFINKRLEIIHGTIDVSGTLNQLAADCNKLLN
jgi:multiple sugar transport system substrate-binding protein